MNSIKIFKLAKIIDDLRFDNHNITKERYDHTFLIFNSLSEDLKKEFIFQCTVDIPQFLDCSDCMFCIKPGGVGFSCCKIINRNKGFNYSLSDIQDAVKLYLGMEL